ncbi:hypothetical protein HDU98_003310 [Podochytrium sp. JEL0797]|nr:hypothetical protein HDU98_003310 [Podochytrium sp. JEL0797]
MDPLVPPAESTVIALDASNPVNPADTTVNPADRDAARAALQLDLKRRNYLKVVDKTETA